MECRCWICLSHSLWRTWQVNQSPILTSRLADVKRFVGRGNSAGVGTVSESSEFRISMNFQQRWTTTVPGRSLDTKSGSTEFGTSVTAVKLTVEVVGVNFSLTCNCIGRKKQVCFNMLHFFFLTHFLVYVKYVSSVSHIAWRRQSDRQSIIHHAISEN